MSSISSSKFQLLPRSLCHRGYPRERLVVVPSVPRPAPKLTLNRRNSCSLNTTRTTPSLADVRARGANPHVITTSRIHAITLSKSPDNTISRCHALNRQSPEAQQPPRASSSGTADHEQSPARLAVFVSGGGSNFRCIHAAILDGRINGRVCVVISDKPECGGCDYARAQGVPVLAYPRSSKHAPEGLSPEELVQQLKVLHGVDFVLLAGFLKLLPQQLVCAFPRSILNIHPALLPAFGGKGFYGLKVHEAVVRSGARVSGPTIHFVDEKYDSGVIVAQRAVPVYHTDTPEDLQKRVLKEEHSLYPEVVAALCDGRVRWREDGVPYIVETVNSDSALLSHTASVA